MKNISEDMDKYCQCIKNIWNNHFLEKLSLQNDWDFYDMFDDISVSLFSALVLYPYGHDAQKKANGYIIKPEPISSITIVPISEKKVSLLVNRELNICPYWDYPTKNIDIVNVKMQFIDFFDFGKLEYREFEFYRVRIVKSDEAPELLGRDALIKRQDVSAFLETLE